MPKVNSSELKRYNFYLSNDMALKLEWLSHKMNLKVSQTLRMITEEFIKRSEEERIEKEAIEACQFYYETDRQLAEEFRPMEAKI